MSIQKMWNLQNLILLSTFLINNACNVNEVGFLGKCWCEPGWESYSGWDRPLNCTKPILSIDGCECEPGDLSRSFLHNDSWSSSCPGDINRWTNLCRWNKQVGVPRSIPVEWMDNQMWKQLGFYKKELPQKSFNHLKTRLREFAVAFKHWDFLNHTHLGTVIEFGAGGYTQTRNLMEHVTVGITNVTFVEPLLEHFMSIPGCSYGSGRLTVNGVSYDTALSNLTVEEFGRIRPAHQQYDTVIVMNVLVYARDAFEFLETVYHSLKPGGLLLFHDRWFEDSVKSSTCKTAGFFVNVIQVSKELLDHFLSLFSREPYFSSEQTKGQIFRSKEWCQWKDDELGYFVAVRKLSGMAIS